MLAFALAASGQTYFISTVAGGGPPFGSPAADLAKPNCVATDAAGKLYICAANHVLIYNAAGALIATIGNGSAANSGDGGPASAAGVSPSAVAVDQFGNVFVAEYYYNRIRKVTAATGIITTIAGTGTAGFGGDGRPATAAILNGPLSIAVDRQGNLFVSDSGNARVRRVSASSGTITSVAGNGTSTFSGDGGPATAASLNPSFIAVGGNGDFYVSDFNNYRVRKVTAATGIITTVAGNGVSGYNGDGMLATSAYLSAGGLAIDSGGNLLVADGGSNRIRRIAQDTGIITTVAGNGTAGFSGDGGPATAASLNSPTSIAFDAGGNLFIVDSFNSRIRRVAVGSSSISTFAGGGTGGDGGAATNATLLRPIGVTVDGGGNLFVADTDANRIRKVAASTGVITTVAGIGGLIGFSGDGGPATSASLAVPTDVAVDGLGNLFIADEFNGRIRKVAAGSGVISTVAGGGVGASFGDPFGVTVAGNGDLFIAELLSSRIYRVAAGTGAVTTVAGSTPFSYGGDGGPATSASLNFPSGTALDTSGNLFIADTYNHRIRKIAAGTNVITTVAGNGTSGYGGDGGPATAASLNAPTGVAVDLNGNLFISDSGNNRIRKVAAGTGVITTVAGTGVAGFSGDGGISTAATLAGPGFLVIDALGNNIYVADISNGRIRRLTQAAQFAADRTSLNFGARPTGLSPAQTVNLNAQAGLAWTATPSAGNIQVNPAAGTSSGPVNISVTAGAGGTVVLTAPGALPITITVSITNLPMPDPLTNPNPSNIIGFVDQPGASQTTGFAGAIPVTGWALDDVGLAKVSLYREIIAHDSAASIVYVLGRALIPIGDAIFLPNTRPDVAAGHPAAPQSDRAGWGMLFLTNTTLNNNSAAGYGGNGTYVLHIIATSVEGFQFELGRRTITVDNAHSPLPFGTIDTPTQGEPVTLNPQYVNFGWALTNPPNSIPTDGSTMFVSLDGANAGKPTYGFPRADIDSLFPGYLNTGKAVGYFYLDTTKLQTGIHSIAWSVRDSGGNLQGIGSRVFYVTNPALPAAEAVHTERLKEAAYRTGPDFEAPLKALPDVIVLKPGERLEVHTGREIVPGQHPLPGSTVEGDVFYWQPPIMALGDFSVILGARDGEVRLNIRTTLAKRKDNNQ